MFLGPAILSGRLAGQSIAAATTAVENEPEILSTEQSGSAGAWQPTMTSGDLEELLAEPRDGYWHFQASHRLVLERRYICASCHSAELPFSSISDPPGLLLQTRVCTTCH
jgi:hypothetical protein